MRPVRHRVLTTSLLVFVTVVGSVPWAFGYLLPQSATLPLALASLAGYSPYQVLVALLVAVLLRAWPAAVVAAALVAAQVVTLGPAYVGEPAGSGTTLTVMTSNLRFGRADAHQLVAAVARYDVDVLAVEELTTHGLERLEAAGLRRQLPFSVEHPAYGGTGTGLWSRWPMREVAQRRLTFESAAGEIDVDGHTIRLRALHPPPPVGGPPGAWLHDYSLLQAQARDDLGMPTILLGDFNASVHHRALRRLMGSRWRDAAEVRGAGLVRTFAPWEWSPAVLDPDHVLVDTGMGVSFWRRLHIDNTDHRAVVARVVLR